MSGDTREPTPIAVAREAVQTFLKYRQPGDVMPRDVQVQQSRVDMFDRIARNRTGAGHRNSPAPAPSNNDSDMNYDPPPVQSRDDVHAATTGGGGGLHLPIAVPGIRPTPPLASVAALPPPPAPPVSGSGTQQLPNGAGGSVPSLQQTHSSMNLLPTPPHHPASQEATTTSLGAPSLSAPRGFHPSHPNSCGTPASEGLRRVHNNRMPTHRTDGTYH